MGTWAIYAQAKNKIGAGSMALGAGVFKMSLHTTAASAAITNLAARDKWSSVGNEVAVASHYAAGGKALAPATGQWVVGQSARQYKFTYSTAGVIYTGTLTNVRYACIRKSVGSATSGAVLCYATLSTAQFSVTSPNTLTILPAATGVFTLA